MDEKTKQYIHFSFDDVYECLQDITVHADQYESIFENAFFRWLKKMHDTYGAVFSLYTFNYFSGVPEYDLSQLPDKYASELIESADWLKFGFHAKDDLKKYTVDEPQGIQCDYEKFYAAMLHACHNHTACIDHVVRLGWFAGTKENVLALRDRDAGIQGLLSADDNRLPYYFSPEEAEAIRSKGERWIDGLLILRSQPRFEGVCAIEPFLETIKKYTVPKVIALFSHECCFPRNSRVDGYTMQELYELVIKWAYTQGYGFDFAQNLYSVPTQECR